MVGSFKEYVMLNESQGVSKKLTELGFKNEGENFKKVKDIIASLVPGEDTIQSKLDKIEKDADLKSKFEEKTAEFKGSQDEADDDGSEDGEQEDSKAAGKKSGEESAASDELKLSEEGEKWDAEVKSALNNIDTEAFADILQNFLKKHPKADALSNINGEQLKEIMDTNEDNKESPAEFKSLASLILIKNFLGNFKDNKKIFFSDVSRGMVYTNNGVALSTSIKARFPKLNDIRRLFEISSGGNGNYKAILNSKILEGTKGLKKIDDIKKVLQKIVDQSETATMSASGTATMDDKGNINDIRVDSPSSSSSQADSSSADTASSGASGSTAETSGTADSGTAGTPGTSGTSTAASQSLVSNNLKSEDDYINEINRLKDLFLGQRLNDFKSKFVNSDTKNEDYNPVADIMNEALFDGIKRFNSTHHVTSRAKGEQADESDTDYQATEKSYSDKVEFLAQKYTGLIKKNFATLSDPTTKTSARTAARQNNVKFIYAYAQDLLSLERNFEKKAEPSSKALSKQYKNEKAEKKENDKTIKDATSDKGRQRADQRMVDDANAQKIYDEMEKGAAAAQNDPFASLGFAMTIKWLSTNKNLSGLQATARKDADGNKAVRTAVDFFNKNIFNKITGGATVGDVMKSPNGIKLYSLSDFNKGQQNQGLRIIRPLTYKDFVNTYLISQANTPAQDYTIALALKQLWMKHNAESDSIIKKFEEAYAKYKAQLSKINTYEDLEQAAKKASAGDKVDEAGFISAYGEKAEVDKSARQKSAQGYIGAGALRHKEQTAQKPNEDNLKAGIKSSYKKDNENNTGNEDSTITAAVETTAACDPLPRNLYKKAMKRRLGKTAL